jgi:hypothetical protein
MAPMAIVAAAGGVMGAAGAIYQGKAEAAAAEYNARLLKLQASQIRQQAASEEKRALVGARKVIGEMRANYGASGVTMEGSPIDIMEESIKNANTDAMNIRYQGEMNARSAEYEAKMERMKGNSAKNASYFSAAQSLGTGATKAHDYNKLSRT